VRHRLHGAVLLGVLASAGTQAQAAAAASAGGSCPDAESFVASVASEATMLPDQASRLGCNPRTTICLTPTGDLVDGEELPTPLRPGDVVSIKVIGCKALYADGVTFVLSVRHIASTDRLFKEAVDATEGLKSDGSCPPLCTDPNDIVVLEEAAFTVPKDESLSTFAIDFERKAAGSFVTGARSSHEIAVIQGRYFIDLGILVPAVLGGRRSVVTVDAGGRAELEVRQRMPPPAPAVMLNVFPGGRRLGVFQSFGEVGRCDPAKAEFFECRRARNRRNAANSLGVQVGMDLDFTDATDAFYLGALFEPVTGLSVNVGASLRKGEFLRPGVAQGQIVTDPTDAAPDRGLMIRPYFGITLSLDIIRTVASFAGRARATKGGN
jgi:hypothetical protein